ncbi:cytochrome P450 [Micromonospora andamanensis]|uniref:Cytochrome P450 n=1 Tax=Micromonospora andamanensis TaxID=1287068 RepID=A0ABQ4HTF4_9ACTN|nr:cytochrome P450 [Micromonospora andamanensis]GIJ08917.1 cytochrome P450 [Micromonospora andamanensis]
MSSSLPRRVEPLEILDDPYPTYADLRVAGPLCRFGPGVWGVTRHADVTALLRDPRLGSEFPADYHRVSGGGGPATQLLRRILLYRDPPAHTRLRRLVGKALTPAVVRAMRADIGAIADELLSAAWERGEFDGVAEVAYPLPVQVICRLLDLPVTAGEELRQRATDLGRAFNQIVPQEAGPRADSAATWLREYVSDQLAGRRADPGGDLLSQLLAAEDHGDALTRDEVVDNAVFAFFAGFETTVHLIATGLAALAADESQQRRLREDPSLIPAAVEEFLRYDSPIQGVARLVREPVELGGRTIRPGRVLVLMLGSANHDEAAFADPGRLDITRHPNPHVAFGGGAHLCLGAYLAREEASAVLGWLVRRGATLRSAGAAAREPGSPFRGYARLPLRFTTV